MFWGIWVQYFVGRLQSADPRVPVCNFLAIIEYHYLTGLFYIIIHLKSLFSLPLSLCMLHVSRRWPGVGADSGQFGLCYNPHPRRTDDPQPRNGTHHHQQRDHPDHRRGSFSSHNRGCGGHWVGGNGHHSSREEGSRLGVRNWYGRYSSWAHTQL